MSETVYIAVGSNLGDRRDNVQAALELLVRTPGVVIVRRSALYETSPVGGPAGQGAYLNGAIEATTDLDPAMLLARLHDVEARLGRVRSVPDAPRPIDLDLLFYGDHIHDDPALMLPHPRLHERLFVLDPLAEIAPGLIHPRFRRSIAQLRAALLGIASVDPVLGRELRGLRTLVTGSTSGIGRAIALEFAAAGADVFIHGRRSNDAAADAAAAVRRLGGRSTTLLADLADASACDVLMDHVWSTWGGLDILVNNAGADTLTGDAANWSFERKLEALWAVDVRATMQLSRGLGRRMKEAGEGVVLTVGWDQAEVGMEGDSGELFAATKGAVMAFTRSLALSLAPQVRVHCLAPGWIRTAWGETASEMWQERVRRETPLRRWGLPEDVARVARWLVSPAANYLTGQVVRVNGGAVR